MHLLCYFDTLIYIWTLINAECLQHIVFMCSYTEGVDVDTKFTTFNVFPSNFIDLVAVRVVLRRNAS